MKWEDYPFFKATTNWFFVRRPRENKLCFGGIMKVKDYRKAKAEVTIHD